MKGTTSKGFEYDIEEKVFDNMELSDAFAKENEPGSPARICELILGEEQKNRMFDYFRLSDKRVPMKEIEETMVEIINAFTEAKNS